MFITSHCLQIRIFARLFLLRTLLIMKGNVMQLSYFEMEMYWIEWSKWNLNSVEKKKFHHKWNFNNNWFSRMMVCDENRKSTKSTKPSRWRINSKSALKCSQIKRKCAWIEMRNSIVIRETAMNIAFNHRIWGSPINQTRAL